MKKRAYLWVTLGFFVVSLSAQWTFGWFAYVEEQNASSQPIETGSYFN